MPALPRATGGRWGILLAALAFAAGCLAFAAVSPANGSADEPLHVDYAYQVWHGQLPVFEDGLLTRPEGVAVPPVQWTAQHPPLFYVLLAPVVGPLIDGGHPLTAVLAARLVCALIAVLCLLALAWAAAQLPTRRPAAWALTAAAVAAPIVPFLRVGGTVYSDNLAVLFTVLALGLTVRILLRGWSAVLLALVAVTCGLGALSRATFVITLVVVTAGLGLAGLRNPGPGPGRASHPVGRRIGMAVALAAVPPISVVLAAGWFYRRNVELTGSWTGGHPDWSRDNLGRTTSPLRDVLTDATFWRIPLDLLTQSPGGWARASAVVLVALPVAGLVGAALRLARRGHPRADATSVVLVVGLLAAQVLGTPALTAGYIAGGGGTAGRYLLPALFPLALALAAGVLAAGSRWSTVVLLGYGVAAWLPFIRWIVEQPDGAAGNTRNDVPLPAVWVLLTVLGLAVVGRSEALVRSHRAREVDLAAEPPSRRPVPADRSGVPA